MTNNSFSMWLGTKWRKMQMILSIMLLLSSFPNACAVKIHSWASCLARRLAQQVALVCGGLKCPLFTLFLYLVLFLSRSLKYFYTKMYTSRKKFKISALITRIVFVWKGARAESISLMSLLSSNDYILTQKGKIFLWNTIKVKTNFKMEFIVLLVQILIRTVLPQMDVYLIRTT
jgi:hypothetical protein